MKTATLLALSCLFLFAGCLSSSLPSQPQAAGTCPAGRAAEVDVPGPEGLAAFRERGPAGLKELLDRNADIIDAMDWIQMPLDDPRAVKVRATVDAVAMQRDAFMSKLYSWSSHRG